VTDAQIISVLITTHYNITDWLIVCPTHSVPEVCSLWAGISSRPGTVHSPRRCGCACACSGQPPDGRPGDSPVKRKL